MSFGCTFIKLYLFIVISLCYSDGDLITLCSIRNIGGEGEHGMTSL